MKSRVSNSSEEKAIGERNLKEQAVEMNTLLARAITGPYSDSKYSEISRVISFIKEERERFKPEKLHQKVILLMGPTGVGKSTLVNYIAGRKMIVRENRSGFALYPEHPITQVGQGSNSTTLLPNVWSADISGFEEVSFVDCAGDFDTSGVVIETLNAMIKQEIASRAQQVKIIIVGTQGSLTSEGAYGAVFKEGLSKSAQFLGNITDFQENIALVVSHSNRRPNVLNHIENALRSILEQSGNPLADYTGIIRYVTENNRFTYFCKPSEEAADGDEYSLPPALNQRESIVNLIRNRINFKDVQVGSYFRTSASREVQQAMGSAINIVKRKSIITLKSEMDSIISTRLSIHPAQLETFSDELERTISIKDNLKLSDYVTRFNRNAFLPKITNSSINKLSSELEFLSQFANIPETNNWGSEVDIRDSFEVLTTEITGIKQHSSKIFGTRFTHDKDIVSCKGYKVNMSEVEPFVSGKANIKEVRIFALNEVIIDRNLITPSINVCIIAPKWTIAPEGTIESEFTINLSGLDNNSYPDNRQKADNGIVYEANGNDGKPGLPGFSGGNFLGIGNEFIGLDKLTIISNGGRGGPGQNGGDGADGKQGLDANIQKLKKYLDKCFALVAPSSVGLQTFMMLAHPGVQVASTLANRLDFDDETLDEMKETLIKRGLKAQFDEHMDPENPYVLNGLVNKPENCDAPRLLESLQDNIHIDEWNRDSDSKRYKHNASIWERYYYYRKYGTKGKQGGNSGKPGAGGLGGKAGTITIFNLLTNEHIRDSVGEEGNIGINGQVGMPGNGGPGGKTAEVAYRWTSTSAGHTWVPVWGGAVVTQVYDTREHCAQVKDQKHYDRHLDERKFTGDNGSTTEILNSNFIQLSPRCIHNLVSVQQGYLNFSLSVGNRLKYLKLVTDFSLAIQNSNIFKINQISDLISQSITIEENFSLQHSDNYLSFYESLKRNIKEFYEQNAENLANGDIRVLNYIYSLACSSICRFNASKDTVLVVDIKTFFSGVQTDITRLQTLESQRIKDSYRTNYNGNISNKIREAESFVTLLLSDIDNYKRNIDDNIVALIQEIENLQKGVEKNTQELLRKKQELKNILATKQLLGGLNIGCQALGFLGPLGSGVGEILSSGMEMAAGFALHESGQPVNITIPEGVYAGIDNISRYVSAEKEKVLKKLQGELEALELERLLEQLPSVPSGDLPHVRDSGGSFEERLQSFKKERSDPFILELELRIEKLQGNNPELIAKLEQDLKNAKDLEYEEVAAELRTKQQQASDKEIKNLARLQKVALGLNVAKAAVDLYRTTQVSQSQIKIIEDAINDNSAKVLALDKKISQVLDMHGDMIAGVKQQIDIFNSKLRDRSHVALDVDKWNIKKYLSEIKSLIEDFTKGFKAESVLSNTIQRLQEGIETLIGIYDRVQSYKDHVEFVNYISSINSNTTVDNIPVEYRMSIDKIRRFIARNIVTEQYNKAMKAFSQWAFPFVEHYLEELKHDLPDCIPILSYQKTEEDIVRQIAQVIERLKQKIDESEAVVNPKIDNIRFSSTFDKIEPFDPFFEWSYEQNSKEIDKLLQGDEATLIADARNSTHDAIKFATIGIKIELTNPEQNIELQKLLENFQVELTHSGISSYKYNNKIYKISSNGPSGEQINLVYQYGNIDRGTHLKHANEAYKKLKQNIPILSPYTTWKIRISPINQRDHLIFNKIPKKLSSLKISLIGHGHYVKVSNTLKIPEHYKQYEAEEGEISTFFQSQFPVCKKTRGITIDLERPDINIDHQHNAFNQRSRVEYFYQATDISIIQKQLMIDPDRFSINEPLGNNIGGNILRGIQTLIEKLETTEKTTLGVYNLGNYHWVSMAVYKKGLSTVVLYKDSYGFGNEVLAKYCEENGYEFLFNDQCEQTSGVDCGIFALKNMQILAQNLQNDEPNFYRSFQKYKNFCSLSTAQSLRSRNYSNLYLAGIYRNIQEEKQKAEILLGIRLSKEGELQKIVPNFSEVIRSIDPTINIRILGALEILGSGVINTITLEIATKDESFNLNVRSCQYGYKISWTQDLEDSIGERIKATVKSISEYTFDDSKSKTIIYYSRNQADSIVDFIVPGLPPVNIQELCDNLNVSLDLTDNIESILQELDKDYIEDRTQQIPGPEFNDSLFNKLDLLGCSDDSYDELSD
jgi:GTPase SAR1 family protein